MLQMLERAAGVALPTSSIDQRNFWLGCVGIRSDGAIVSSRNGATEFSTFVENYQLLPTAHAEGRILRKLGKYGTLYISRVSRKDGSFKLAKPCRMCQVQIKSARVEKVHYSIDDQSYGLWLPAIDKWQEYKG